MADKYMGGDLEQIAIALAAMEEGPEKDEALRQLYQDYEGQTEIVDDALATAEAELAILPPEGRQAGEVYVAADPTEHLAAALRNIGGAVSKRRNVQRLEDLSADRTAGMDFAARAMLEPRPQEEMDVLRSAPQNPVRSAPVREQMPMMPSHGTPMGNALRQPPMEPLPAHPMQEQASHIMRPGSQTQGLKRPVDVPSMGIVERATQVPRGGFPNAKGSSPLSSALRKKLSPAEQARLIEEEELALYGA